MVPCFQAVRALIDLFQVICGETTGAISKSLYQTIKSTAYAENMYIAYLLSLVACQLNGMDFQHEAEVLHRRALCIGIRCIGSSNPLLADSMEWLAFSLYRQGNNKEALLLSMNALVILQSSLGRDHPETGNCYLNLSVLLESLGVKKHAVAIQRQGEAIVSGTLSRRQKRLIKSKQGGGGGGGGVGGRVGCVNRTKAAPQRREKAAIEYLKSSGVHGLSVF